MSLKEIPISPEKSPQVPPSSAERGFALLGGFQQRFPPEFGKIRPPQKGELGRGTMQGKGTELRHRGALKEVAELLLGPNFRKPFIF